MTINPADSDVLGAWFCTPAMRDAFSDRARFQAMLDVEAALARAQASLGLIPPEAARRITEAASVEAIDLGAVAAGTASGGYPVMPLVRELARAAGDEAGGYVHWGTTTQDIMDTALVLQMRTGLALLEADLDALVAALAGLADAHRGTVMAGRTHLQHALPVTFGLKAAGWLAPLLRTRDRLRAAARRALVVQFAGAAGTLASLAPHGIAVAEALGRELDLPVPEIGWHAARDGLAEIAGVLGILAGTCGKIAGDVALLMQAEIAEAFEPAAPGRGGSSAMPQKRNPVAGEYVIAGTRNIHQLVAVMLGSLVADHERATGPGHAEWLAMPQIFALSSGVLRNTLDIAGGLEIDPARMRANLDATQGLILAERVMMALAPAIGRQEAHDRVEAICRAVCRGEGTFAELLRRDAICAARLSADEVDRLLDPAGYTGEADRFIDRVLARAGRMHRGIEGGEE